MVILKSNKNLNYWVCGALIYSGRSDPQWTVSEQEAEHLVDLWNTLPISKNRVVLPGILGYKGCFLSSSAKMKWVSFRGIVTCYRDGKIVESRTDTERVFERKILDTAPSDIIPKAMLIEEFN